MEIIIVVLLSINILLFLAGFIVAYKRNKGFLANMFDFIKSSLDTHSTGASARKLSAWWTLCILITLCHLAWLQHAYSKQDFSELNSILIIDYCFAALCLGLTTTEQLMKLWASIKGNNTTTNKEVVKTKNENGTTNEVSIEQTKTNEQ